jgi:hypothetical protein
MLEPLSYLIYLGALLFYAWRLDRKFHYRVLCGYYLIATALLVKGATEYSSSNTYIYNMMCLITSMFIGYYFYTILFTPLKKGIAVATGVITIAYYLFSDTTVNNIQLFDSIGHVISSSGIVLLIFLFLHQVMTNVNEEPLSHNFDFWYVCSLLIYHLGAFAIFLSYNYFTRKVLPAENYSDENRTILSYLWVGHNVLLLLGALLTSVGAGLIFYKKKSQLPRQMVNQK